MTRKRKKSSPEPNQSQKERVKQRTKKTEDKMAAQSGSPNTSQYVPNGQIGQIIHSGQVNPLMHMPHTPLNTQPCNQYMYNLNMGATPGPMWGGFQPVTYSPSATNTSTSVVGDNDVLKMILSRLDQLDKIVPRLDSIEGTVKRLDNHMAETDRRIHGLEERVKAVEESRQFDSDSTDKLNKQHKEMDSLIQKLKKYESEQRESESTLKAEITNLKCRSMTDNLLFHRITEEKDEQCENKIRLFIEEKLKIAEAQAIRIQRAHRIGTYRNGKTRPIFVKFTDFPEREKVRKAAKELRGTKFGISEQFPKDILDKRRQLVPTMLKAREEGKEAFLKVDKLYINNQLYREPL